MIDSYTIIIAVGVFIIAGIVKGVLGLGLPTISLALLTVAIDLPSAMSIMLVPSLITNIWQAFIGGNFKSTLIRIWPFILFAFVFSSSSEIPSFSLIHEKYSILIIFVFLTNKLNSL